jgi:hypothetical protein
MLSGNFYNCYGIRQLTFPNIRLHGDRYNRILIYAPNGVMKTSFAKLLEDLSNGRETTDRIFTNAATRYELTYRGATYSYPPAIGDTPPKAENICVVNSFSNTFEFTKETVDTLLADDTTRHHYDELMTQLKNTVDEILLKLRSKSGLTKPRIKEVLLTDFELETTSDWPDIIESINSIPDQHLTFLDSIRYVDVFNEKTEIIYQNPDFQQHITEYISVLEHLLENNELLTRDFTDQNVEKLGQSLSGNNLFAAHHKILLSNGREISTLDEWKDIVQQQLNIMYQNPDLSHVFENLKKMFSKNVEAATIRKVITDHREIIPYLADLNHLRQQMWKTYFEHLDQPFEDYYSIIIEYRDLLHGLNEEASRQSESWTHVVNLFNQRFKVPFTAKIVNKSNFILKDEAPNIEFDYSRGEGTERQETQLRTDELKEYLSMGEKRALYLLYVIFNLEKIRKLAQGTNHFLIVADDLADSFDYKNKYAIIEYLDDLVKTPNLDLLILTHNFDFYRTVKLRLDIKRCNCLIAQKSENGTVSLSEFRYQRDFFKNVIYTNIATGTLDNNEKKKCLIASIPFYRNLIEYSGAGENENGNYQKLTCCLHYKTAPWNTELLTISEIWEILKPYLNNTQLQTRDIRYLQLIREMADTILLEDDEVSLENKLVLSIASRLVIEKYMKSKIVEHERFCPDANNNQTREWFNHAKQYMSTEEISIAEEVNLITPESIHLNAFMYEPLIDISAWSLKDVYRKCCALFIEDDH